MKKLISLFIDALRPDFINKKDTPFLYKLSSEKPPIELVTLLGYSDAIDASIFTGTYPDTNGYWMKFQYSPRQSIFNKIPLTQPLMILDYIPTKISYIRSGINLALYYTVYKKISKQLGYDELGSFNIPYRYLTKFDMTLKKSLIGENPFINIPTIFDILRSKNKSYYYTHNIKKDTIKILKNSTLSIVYFSDADAAAHLFGINCPRFYNSLKKLDNKIKFIFERFKGEKDTNFIIFSDHGMAPVHTIFTFKELFKKQGFNKRFFLALDGTMVRFWYFDNKIKNEVRNLFENAPYGHFLNQDEKTNLRINFQHNKYGDDIFLLNQGYAIFPNYMSWARPHAMHAYHPSYKEQRGVVILSGNSFENNQTTFARPVDIMPSILNALDIAIPSTVEGKSLIKE
jgi:predicted AlkP superfamily pyrophosphatase or phosphodiesterase